MQTASEVILARDASVLAKQVVAENVQPMGIPPLKELIAFALDHGVPAEDLGWLNSKWVTPKEVTQITVEVDRVISF